VKSLIDSNRYIILLGLALVLLTACGGATLQVQGAQFAVNGAEATLADEYTRADPVQAPPQVRCQYWARRSMEASRGHQIGVVIWPPQHFVTLHAWTQAVQAETCAVVRLAAQQHQAQVVQRHQEDVSRQRQEAQAEAERQKAALAAANLQRCQAFLDTFEAQTASFEGLVTGLEHAKEPWRDDQFSQLLQIKEIADAVHSHAGIPSGGCDKSLNPRLDGIMDRFQAITQRLEVLQPRMDRLLAAMKRKQTQDQQAKDAAAMAMLQQVLQARAAAEASPEGQRRREDRRQRCNQCMGTCEGNGNTHEHCRNQCDCPLFE
jgi:hypothetical protein